MLTIEESETSINNEQECSNSSLQLAELEVTKTPRTVNKVGNHERTTNGISVRHKFIVNNGNPKLNTIKKRGRGRG
ncbi:unnamed protein product [Amaranthus hypochondriacus]